MKILNKFLTILLLFIVSNQTMKAQSYENLWAQVEEAIKMSLPKTVVDVTQTIYNKALTEKNAGQLFKSYVYNRSYTQELTPDSFYVQVKELEQWASVEKTLSHKAMLHVILANFYGEYRSDNQYELSKRTDLPAGEIPEDIREWTDNVFFLKTVGHVSAALQDKEALLRENTMAYRPFARIAEGSQYFHHDLYHLIALQAIDALKAFQTRKAHDLVEEVFRGMKEAYLNKPGYEDAAILTLMEECEWKQGQDLKTDIGDWDRFINRYSDRELSLLIYEKKMEAQQEQHPAAALRTFDEAQSRFPKSKLLASLKNRRNQIQSKELSVSFNPQVYPSSRWEVNLTFQNLGEVRVKLYETNLKRPHPGFSNNFKPGDFKKTAVKEVFRQDFALVPDSKENRLPEDAPYFSSDTTLVLHAPVKSGIYLVEVSTPKASNKTRYSYLTVSRLGVVRLKLANGQTEWLTVDAQTGKPMSGVNLNFYNRRHALLDRYTLISNSDGLAAHPKPLEQVGYLKAYFQDEYLATDRLYDYYGPNNLAVTAQKTEKLTLLTDRSVYRPGQTVYVKGIAFEQTGDDAHVLSDKHYKLTLFDVNQTKVLEQDFLTNEFGSFSGRFVLPASVLNGEFSIRCNQTTTSFRVEEYKRPTFEITFNPVPTAYVAGDTVTCSGRVKAYNGASLQDVPLTYILSKKDRYDWRDRVEPVASDTVLIDKEGNFSISFQIPAIDPSVEFETDWQLQASVTDVTGETQTETYLLRVGNCRYHISMPVPQQVCKDESIRLLVSLFNWDQVPQHVPLLYSVYKVAKWDDEDEQVLKRKPVYTARLEPNKEHDFNEWKGFESGIYLVRVTVEGESPVNDPIRLSELTTRTILYSQKDKSLKSFVPLFADKTDQSFGDDGKARFLFGTSYADAYVYLNVFDGNHRRIDHQRLKLDNELRTFEYTYQPEYGNGLSVQLAFVKEGSLFEKTFRLTKPIPKVNLGYKWRVFRDKLLPGSKEEWQLVLTDPSGKPAVAELLATMYDASLDPIYQRFQSISRYFNRDLPSLRGLYCFVGQSTLYFDYPFTYEPESVLEFDSFDIPNLFGYGRRQSRIFVRGTSLMKASQDMVLEEAMVESGSVPHEAAAENAQAATYADLPEKLGQQPGLRSHFAETAFFYPQLVTNEKGEIVFSFTVPESLTRWNFNGYAHTRDMLVGQISETVITAKELMVQPNMPRFVRQGDDTQVASVLRNLSDKAQSGTVRFYLFDPRTEAVILQQQQPFAVEAGLTATVAFQFSVPEHSDMLGVRIVAESAHFSDGEQHVLPVLSNKQFVTETKALHIRGGQTKSFSLEQLFNRHHPSATQKKLTVELTGNPAWYAVQALPSISDPTSDNAIDWMIAYYANALAGYIANSQPRIKAVFENWKNSEQRKEVFLSQLQKNEELKSVLLSETPWVLEAYSEAEQRVRLGLYFDLNQMADRNAKALKMLQSLQLEDGGWAWFKGMHSSCYVTQLVMEQLIRVRLLTGLQPDEPMVAMQRKGFDFLHAEALDEYHQIQRYHPDTKGLSYSAMQYLYLIALSGEKVPAANQKAYDYFLSRVGEELRHGSMSTKAQAAVVLKQAGRMAQANRFVASLKEHLIIEEEKGAHFAFNDTPYAWGMLPIPTHVEVMDALGRFDGNQKLLEEMRIWLLKEKQTTHWGSCIATADAVYALLCNGTDLLANPGDVRITLGNQVLETLRPSKTTVPDLGYVKQSYQDEPTLQARQVQVEDRDPSGVAWGAVYAQYLSPITAMNQLGDELNLNRQFYVERLDATGKATLGSLTDGARLRVGDVVVSRITIKADRALDFVHLKDGRAACFEPYHTLSGYRYSQGLGYYVDVKDAATHFFMDGIGKGVYVVECRYRVDRKGTYQVGLATIQSAYAPEFASHSAGITLVVE